MDNRTIFLGITFSILFVLFLIHWVLNRSSTITIKRYLSNLPYIMSQISKHGIKVPKGNFAVVEIFSDLSSQSTYIPDIVPVVFSSWNEAFAYVERKKSDESLFYILNSKLELCAVMADKLISYVKFELNTTSTDVPPPPFHASKRVAQIMYGVWYGRMTPNQARIQAAEWGFKPDDVEDLIKQASESPSYWSKHIPPD